MSHYANPDALVTCQWLTERLDDPDVAVIDIHLDPGPYANGHVPGAVFWNAIGTLLDSDYRTNSDPAHVAALLGRSGISEQTTVVVTSEHLGLPAWVYWYLKLFGHRDVRVLDGGQRAWRAQDLPTSTDVPQPLPAQYSPQSPLPPSGDSVRARLDDVRGAMTDDDTTLVDVRTDEEFRGDLFMLAPPADQERAGHIPGATHIYYERALNEDGTFRPVDELASLYAEVGITGDTRIITYCAVGMRAGHTWFVLSELLGFPKVRNYDLSWNEWGRLVDTPVE